MSRYRANDPATFYLAKPFDAAKLAAAIARVTGAKIVEAADGAAVNLVRPLYPTATQKPPKHCSRIDTGAVRLSRPFDAGDLAAAIRAVTSKV